MYHHAAEVDDLPQHVPIQQMTAAQRKILWEGKEDYPGIRGFFDQLQNKRYKVSVRVFLARYRGYYPCNECNGQRLRLEARIVKINDLNISQLCLLDVARSLKFMEDLKLSPREQQVTEKILPEVKKASEVPGGCRARIPYSGSPIRNLERRRSAADQPGFLPRLVACWNSVHSG